MSRGTQNNKDIDDLKQMVEEVLNKTKLMAEDSQSFKENQEFVSNQYDKIKTELLKIKKHIEEKYKKINQLEQNIIWLNEELLKQIEKMML